MKQLFADAKAVYRSEGPLALTTKTIRTIIEPMVGEESAQLVYHNLNRLLRYRSIGAPTIDFPRNSITIADTQYNVFFGFYDHTPFCHKNRRVLFNRTTAPVRQSSRTEPLELCYYDINNRTTKKFGESKTWNWQKGCRLRWHPTREDCVIYNTLVDGEYGSVIYNVASDTVAESFQTPIYDVGPKGRYALTVNFSRLERLHEDYGYDILPDTTQGEAVPADDGIFCFNLETGETELLISYAELSDLTDSPDDLEQYVMNIMFSPDSERCCFLHRYHEDGSRVTNFLCTTIEGDESHVLQEKKEASHPFWRSESEILCTVNHWGTERWTEFVLFDVEAETKKTIQHEQLSMDTHPHFSPVNSDLFVGDTYPDPAGDRYLYLYNLANTTYTPLGSVYGPVRNRTKRDLHPRWDREGRYVCIDLPLPGNRRGMSILELSGER